MELTFVMRTLARCLTLSKGLQLWPCSRSIPMGLMVRDNIFTFPRLDGWQAADQGFWDSHITSTFWRIIMTNRNQDCKKLLHFGNPRADKFHTLSTPCFKGYPVLFSRQTGVCNTIDTPSKRTSKKKQFTLQACVFHSCVWTFSLIQITGYTGW